MKSIFSRKVRNVLLAAVLLTVALSVAASALNFYAPDVAVKFILQPLRAGAQLLTNQAEGIYSYLFRYEALEERVMLLEEENARLREEARAASALTREVERLTAALELKQDREDFKMLPAYIISGPSGDWSQTWQINKGETSGVQVGQCVITANGEVVGLIIEAGPNYAVLKSVLDSSLEISATIAASGYCGMVQGGYATGEEGYLRMNHLPSKSVICSNDQVVTAGSTLYPRDLVLGTVVDAGFDESGVAKYAILQPAADFGALEQVFVLTAYAVE